MNLRKLVNLLFLRQKFYKPATITKENIKGFLQGTIRSFNAKVQFLAPADHIMEQSIWRLSQIQDLSPVCLQMGQCKVCGCSIDERVFEDRGCEGQCYPKMMSVVDWEEFKEQHNIHIVL